MKRLKIEEKVALNKYDVDREVHIEVKKEICGRCEERYCLYACPANCYILAEENQVVFSYEPCLKNVAVAELFARGERLNGFYQGQDWAYAMNMDKGGT